MTGLGRFEASWNVTDAGEGYVLAWDTPVGTIGSVILPALPCGRAGSVNVDGKSLGEKRVGASGGTTAGMKMAMEGGSHRVVVRRS